MTEQTDGVLHELREERARQVASPYYYTPECDDHKSIDEWDIKVVAWHHKVVRASGRMAFDRRPAIKERRQALIELAAIIVAEIEAFDRRYSE